MSLPAQAKRKAVFAVLKEGKSVTSVAKELGVARKTIYSWINRYKQTPRRNKSKALESRYVSGKKHPRAVAPKARHKLIRLITSNPEWGCRKLSTKLKDVGFDLGYFGVNQLLSELSASTPELRKNFKRNYSGPGRLEVDIKLEIVRKVLEEKESVSQAAGEYGIARKTIYQWLKKYQAGSDKGFVGVEALKEAYVYGEAHPRAIYPKLTEKVLSIVVKNPEFSVHKLKNFVPASSWTVWKILDRNNLNLYQQRLAYAEKIAASKKPILPVKVFDRIKLVWEQFIPSLAPAPPPGVIRVFKTLGVSSFFSFLFFLGIFSWMRLLGSQSFSGAIGLIFATVALTMGSVFFLYSLKYYLTLAIVLSFSQQEIGEGVNEDGRKRGFLSWILGLTNGNGNDKNKRIGPVGLEPNLEHISLKRKPYISVQIPFYNEKNVVERAITAAINFDYKGKYEVILADDSTDETTSIIRNYQKEHLAKGQKLKEVKGDGWTLTQVEVRPGVILKHIHRTSRSGFKGGALKLALKLTDPKVEFISVFDADFVPYPDTLELFLKYFKVQNNMSEDYKKSNVAVVQGYQWHVLNKSENWITRGVRSEYAGSYVIERSGREIYGALKQISGSVYMIRKDVLEEVGWKTSITEDFQLTLRLYEKGYKVVYTPYIQAPAECVSTLKRLIRQRMRWAEGHSNNVKKMFKRLMFNPKLTTGEKLEFLYLSPYYLQAFFFMVGTISWLISETIFAARLPFWTSLWGWSLVLTNMLSLPLVNAVGLFLEESEEKDYTGLASFVALSYILVPFQAYASIRGFLKEEEGPWFRTPKTGKITDIFTRGRFYRFISGILPGRTQPVVAPATKKYLALSTVNSRFNPFSVRPKYRKLYSKATLSVLLIVVLLLNYLTFFVPEVAYAQAADPAIEQQINIIDQEYSTTSTSSGPTDNSLGLVQYDGTKYSGSSVSVYLETIIKKAQTGDDHDVGMYISVDCPTADDCKIVYHDNTEGDLRFVDCDNEDCSERTITILDGASNCALLGCLDGDIGETAKIDCSNGASDCKIAYLNRTREALYFADCDNATCSEGTVKLLDGYTDCPLIGCNPGDFTGIYISMDCSNGTDDCKIAYHNNDTSAIYFIDCASADCSHPDGTVQLLDGAAGCPLQNCTTDNINDPFIDCSNGATDCKIAYRNSTNTDLYFIDCESADCSSSLGTVTLVSTNYPYGTSIDCSNGTGDCKISYSTNSALYFVDCNDATCSSKTSQNLDGIAECVLDGCDSARQTGLHTSIDCSNGATDCKIAYDDYTTGVKDLRVVDCASADCGSPLGTSSLAASSGDVGSYVSMDCSNGATDCKIAHRENDTLDDLTFTDCNNAACSSATTTEPDTGAELTWAELYTDTGVKVSDGIVDTASSSYERVRTGSALTLVNGEEYTVRIKSSDSTDNTAYIKAARLIITQSDPTNITNTQTQIEVGDDDSTSSTTAVSLTDPKHYMYDDDKFSGTTNAYFEATLRAAPPTNTVGYHFTGYDAGQAWPNYPGYMVDGNEGTSADNGGGDATQLNNVSSCGASCASRSETISKVEIRVRACQNTGDNGEITLTPVFSGGEGDGHTWSSLPATCDPLLVLTSWSPWYNITNDSNAEDWAEWSDIQNLDVKVFGNRIGGADIIWASEVEIQVSYEPAVTASAGLYNITNDPDILVVNSTVSTSSTSWDRARGASKLTTNWDASNDDEYEVRIWASDGTAYISNAKIIIEQNDAAGLTDIEMVHQYINTKATETGASYVAQDYDNLYDADHFAGGTFTYIFEATLKDNGGTSNARLTPGPLGNVSGSASYSRQFSASITPVDDAVYDTEIVNADVSTSWLKIQVSNLQIPENLLLFLPLVVFIPAIFRKGFNLESLNLGVLGPVIPRKKYRRKRIYYSDFVEKIDDG